MESSDDETSPEQKVPSQRHLDSAEPYKELLITENEPNNQCKLIHLPFHDAQIPSVEYFKLHRISDSLGFHFNTPIRLWSYTTNESLAAGDVSRIASMGFSSISLFDISRTSDYFTQYNQYALVSLGMPSIHKVLANRYYCNLAEMNYPEEDLDLYIYKWVNQGILAFETLNIKSTFIANMSDKAITFDADYNLKIALLPIFRHQLKIDDSYCPIPLRGKNVYNWKRQNYSLQVLIYKLCGGRPLISLVRNSVIL